MNHPRYSVLSLFDPLTGSTATPKRDTTTPSPDSGSDKENALPPSRTTTNYYESDTLTMTAFFNRTYNTQPTSKHYSPVALRKRLIDVGEVTVTVDDASDLLWGLSIAEESPQVHQDHSESNDDSQFEDAENILETPQRKPTTPVFTPQCSQQAQGVPRTPLADISLDATPVPRKTGKPLPPSAHATQGTPLAKSELASSPVTIMRAPLSQNAAPVGSPLASVINAINTTSHINEPNPDSESHPVAIVVSEPPETDETLNLSAAYPVPSKTAPLLTETRFSESIVLPSPTSPSKDLPSSHTNNTSPSAFLSARPRPRPRSKTTTVAFSRSSVDLHSSFNWQLQCPEASFDLINDRISFFGGDSFVLDTMDDFEMQAEEEMMEALAKRLREKEAGNTASDARRVGKAPISGGKRRQSGVEEIKAQDYAPSSPIVTSTRWEKLDSPVSSPVLDSAPPTVVKPTRRRSLVANLMASPTVRSSSTSRRGSLPSAGRSIPVTDEAPAFQPPRTSLCNLVGEIVFLFQPSSYADSTSRRTLRALPTNYLSPRHKYVHWPFSVPPPSKTPTKAILPKQFAAPAPVQALRVVKRPKAHERAPSPSGAASASSSAGSSSPGDEEQPQVELPVQDQSSKVSNVLLPGSSLPQLRPQSQLSQDLATPLPYVSVKNRLTGALGLNGRAPASASETRPAPTSSESADGGVGRSDEREVQASETSGGGEWLDTE
ncbi:hypothetical protein BU15DRAFT_72199 [Melanogaster broomeanus]|nr:hypothetical protein BU15DRAFT_72199 [Melanogaster broomeanus]